jgi:phosphatidylglycerol lysyltransferase
MNQPRCDTAAAPTHMLPPDAREIVMTYGWNTTAYQILNPGLTHWHSAGHRAVVGYVRRGNVLLVAGAPVCALESLRAVAIEFEEFARAQGCRVCYVCAADRLRDLLVGSNRHATVVIGAQPVWDPRRWSAMLTGNRALRAQLNRARNKGVTIESIPAAAGRHDAQLQRVLAAWLATRALPPLHFLVEPDTLAGAVADRILLIARRAGAIVAFLVASPVPARNGYLIEQVARSPQAPNGTSELLIDAAMRRFAADGRAYATLGLVALSTNAGPPGACNPLWLRALITFARAHANRFYNFRGLERFRHKLMPDRWETIYAISAERRFSIRTLYAMGGAFSGIAPWRAVARGVWRALGQEACRMRRRRSMRVDRSPRRVGC